MSPCTHMGKVFNGMDLKVELMDCCECTLIFLQYCQICIIYTCMIYISMWEFILFFPILFVSDIFKIDILFWKFSKIYKPGENAKMNLIFSYPYYPSSTMINIYVKLVSSMPIYLF